LNLYRTKHFKAHSRLFKPRLKISIFLLMLLRLSLMQRSELELRICKCSLQGIDECASATPIGRCFVLGPLKRKLSQGRALLIRLEQRLEEQHYARERRRLRRLKLPRPYTGPLGPGKSIAAPAFLSLTYPPSETYLGSSLLMSFWSDLLVAEIPTKAKCIGRFVVFALHHKLRAAVVKTEDCIVQI
jgi:hypothetical protein